VSEVVFLRTPRIVARGYLSTLREAGHRLTWRKKVGIWCFVPDGRDAPVRRYRRVRVSPDDALVCGQIEVYLRSQKMDVDDDIVAAILAEVKKLLD
jgi:hypothetical protein